MHKTLGYLNNGSIFYQGQKSYILCYFSKTNDDMTYSLDKKLSVSDYPSLVNAYLISNYLLHSVLTNLIRNWMKINNEQFSLTKLEILYCKS
jgi:hypothetical protein